MSVSAGHLDALLGLSGIPAELYGITVASYTTSGVSPNETLASATVTTTGAGALGTATVASIPETFQIVAVNDARNTATFTVTEDFGGAPYTTQNTFYALGYSQNAILFGYGNSNTTAVSLDIDNNIDLILGVLSTTPIAVGTSLSFTAGGTYSASINTPQSIISDLYLSILGRPADSAGLSAWVAAVGAGVTYAQVAAAFANSGEAQANLNNLYLNILGRAADAGGLAAFTQYLATGGSQTGVAAALANSAEAQSDISGIYQAVLGRVADPGGLAAFQAYLAGGGSLAGTRAILAGSAEAQADVSSIYQSVLGRAADAGGLASFIGYLGAGGSLAGVRSILAGSTEAQADISSIYQSVLGRAADPGGLAAFTGYLATTGSLAGVRTILANSGEGQADVTGILQADYGRAASAAEIAAGQLQLASGLSLTDLNTQSLELAASPHIVSSAGGVLAGTAGVDIFDFGAGLSGLTVVSGFDPAHDLLLLSRSQFPDLATVRGYESSAGGGTAIVLDPAHMVLLQGIAAASLVPADFRFV